ncbi:MAG: hypothetical protein A4E65_00032 [Syntrophorhabdus sp. PtaU1.Bin153]|nr:MAG: hypothetical protein A4E65_00032 [Syntrophorhabdus sp. PtaU1.Bin153]
MTSEMAVLGFGCILLLVGIIGGGLEIKELKIPKIGTTTRFIAVVCGVILIVVGIYLTGSKDKKANPSISPVDRAAAVTPEAAVPQQSKEAAAVTPEATVSQQQNAKDANYTKAIIGSWTNTMTLADGTIYEYTDRYSADGLVFETASIHYKGGGIISLRASFRWYIKDGYLYTKVESSNHPILAPIGQMKSSKILNISSKTLETIDPTDGQRVIDSRVE